MIYLFSLRYYNYTEYREDGDILKVPSILVVTADSCDEARSKARSLLSAVIENHLQYTSTPEETLKLWMDAYEPDFENFQFGEGLFVEGMDLLD